MVRPCRSPIGSRNGSCTERAARIALSRSAFPCYPLPYLRSKAPNWEYPGCTYEHAGSSSGHPAIFAGALCDFAPVSLSAKPNQSGRNQSLSGAEMRRPSMIRTNETALRVANRGTVCNALIVLASCVLLTAQNAVLTGSLSGRVTDESGAVVPGASVVVQS